MMNTKRMACAATVLAVTLMVAQGAMANPGLSITANPMRFVYTQNAGGAGSVGRIDITSTTSASLVLQQVQMGDGGYSATNLGTLGPDRFQATFTADVFKLGGENSYAIVGTYTITDEFKQVVVEGDFASSSIRLVDGAFSIAGDLVNQNGVLRSTPSLSDWQPLASGTLNQGGSSEPNLAGMMAQLGNAATLGNLFQLQLSGKSSRLDDLFAGSFKTETSASIMMVSSVTSIPMIPAPGAAALALVGLGMVLRRPKNDLA